ncbi:hypothetical protein IPZ58_28285 [Streptomyces roseoverticillatus]|uniref:hypothetical protein n=1 Tax=Streptomyces roseoverticillatus TaxID=66429 RepID=UPI001F428B09|nr:hypothetical protein [Streptomyces roseoverticillatus]MCF3105460.1 hypothetical protein [Streptomyces roseoverticillatus]
MPGNIRYRVFYSPMGLVEESYSVNGWGFVGFVAAIVIPAGGVWLSDWLSRRRTRLFCAMPRMTSLLTTAGDVREYLQVWHGDPQAGGRRLSDPHIAQIAITCDGRSDISSHDFQEQPLALDLGAPIVAVLQPRGRPVRPQLAVGHQGAELMIGPCLISRRQDFSVPVLLDGVPVAPLDPLKEGIANVDVVGGTWNERVMNRRVKTIVFCTLVAAVVALSLRLTDVIHTNQAWTIVIVTLFLSQFISSRVFRQRPPL